jgi:hypothetical protein
MSRQILELETLMQELIGEHQRMLKHLVAQHAAMKTMDRPAMEAAARLQEASRLRLLAFENKRKNLVMLIGQKHGKRGKVMLSDIAGWYPDRQLPLLKLRTQLKELVQQVATRAQISNKLAGAVLGHLNTVVRLLAASIEKAGLYTKNGIPKMSARIGVMEAIG